MFKKRMKTEEEMLASVPTVHPPNPAVAERLVGLLAGVSSGGGGGGGGGGVKIDFTPGSPEPRWAEFAEALHHGGCTRLANDLRSLQEAVRRFDALSGSSFWADLLPFACRQALRFPELFPEPIVIVDDSAGATTCVSRVVEWSQAQCLCIQCNALLCSWPQRTSQNCHCTERDARALCLPSINLDEMLCGAGNGVPQIAKCEMFLHYLAKQKARADAGDPLERKLSFVRRKIDTASAAAQQDAAGVRSEPAWVESTSLLRPVAVEPLHTSIDAAKNMLRADFANESIGGGSIAYGCVQEEIMFACHPELNCARLIFTPMLGDEAFILVGAEQFAEPEGYAFKLQCRGPYDDPTEAQPDGGPAAGQLRAFVTAIDAMDYRDPSLPLSAQFRPQSVRRELLKAFAGANFTLFDPSTVLCVSSPSEIVSLEILSESLLGFDSLPHYEAAPFFLTDSLARHRVLLSRCL
jgi:hypothetical protein